MTAPVERRLLNAALAALARDDQLISAIRCAVSNSRYTSAEAVLKVCALLDEHDHETSADLGTADRAEMGIAAHRPAQAGAALRGPDTPTQTAGSGGSTDGRSPADGAAAATAIPARAAAPSPRCGPGTARCPWCHTTAYVNADGLLRSHPIPGATDAFPCVGSGQPARTGDTAGRRSAYAILAKHGGGS